MYVLLFLWYASVLLFYLLILKSSHRVDSVQQITRKDGDSHSCNQQLVFLDTDIQLHITSNYCIYKYNPSRTPKQSSCNMHLIKHHWQKEVCGNRLSRRKTGLEIQRMRLIHIHLLRRKASTRKRPKCDKPLQTRSTIFSLKDLKLLDIFSLYTFYNRVVVVDLALNQSQTLETNIWMVRYHLWLCFRKNVQGTNLQPCTIRRNPAYLR